MAINKIINGLEIIVSACNPNNMTTVKRRPIIENGSIFDENDSIDFPDFSVFRSIFRVIYPAIKGINT